MRKEEKTGNGETGKIGAATQFPIRKEVEIGRGKRTIGVKTGKRMQYYCNSGGGGGQWGGKKGKGDGQRKQGT